jgi:L-lysine 2,3-aminomutase
MKAITFTLDEEVLDIANMEAMGLAGYLPYVEQYLMYVDHHDVLRSSQGGHPIAVTKQQLDALISHLQSVRHQLRDE